MDAANPLDAAPAAAAERPLREGGRVMAEQFAVLGLMFLPAAAFFLLRLLMEKIDRRQMERLRARKAKDADEVA